LPEGRIYPLTGTRCPEKGLPDNKITRYFSKTQKAAWAVQICELYWTHPQSGKITRTPDIPLQQKTIEPLIKDTIDPGTLVYTDEYSIYARLQSWGYGHKHVNHGRGEFARDEDGDGFCEVHVNTMEGFWSLLRSWLRPHRGISQEKLPLYLGFFEFVHNVRKRGKALLGALIELLVTKDPGIQ
jgi:transposase